MNDVDAMEVGTCVKELLGDEGGVSLWETPLGDYPLEQVPALCQLHYEIHVVRWNQKQVNAIRKKRREGCSQFNSHVKYSGLAGKSG